MLGKTEWCRIRFNPLKHEELKLISFVHPNYELYGSDRSFAQCVSAIVSAKNPDRAEVVLPEAGPITMLFSRDVVDLVIEPLWVLRRANLVRALLFKFAQLPYAIDRAHKRMAVSRWTYINTIIALDYMIAARFAFPRVIIHVREIPTGLAMFVFRTLLRWGGAGIIFNSRSTQAAFSLPPSQRQAVVYNGFAGPDQVVFSSWHGCSSSKPLNILILGRINGWKGHDLLVEACAKLNRQYPKKFSLKIVGGVFEGKEPLLDELRDQINSSGLTDVVSIESFNDNPASLYEWCDIVAVPSRKPEPFGRTAIEAMSFGRPVIAADHGGLSEIVEHDQTGWLFEPNNLGALTDKLQWLLDNPKLWASAGERARRRYDALFTEAAMKRNLVAIFDDMVSISVT